HGAYSTDNLLLDWDGIRMKAHVRHVAPAFELGDERAELRVCRRRRRTGSEACDGVVAVARAVLWELRARHCSFARGISGEGEPCFARAAATEVDRQLETERHDADDRCALPGDLNLASDHRRIAAEATLPEPIPQHNDARPVRPILFRGKVAPEYRLHAEDRKDIRMDGRRADALGFVAIEGDRTVAEKADVRERGDACAPSLPLVVREPRLIEALPRAPHDGDAIGVSVG